jgi:serine/threonine-protein kinase
METACLDDETVLAFVEAKVQTAEFVRVNAHLNECDDCRRLVATVARGRYQEGTDVETAPASVRQPTIPAVGTQIDRYVITGLLGKGGMALVFAAFDPQLTRNVALKLLRPDNDERREDRLLREARAMAQLTHPNVLRVYDAGSSEGRVFIAMEYVEGTTLARWLRERTPSWQEIVWAFHAAGRGLAAAHAAGIAHRDFKPANVLLSRKGDVLVSDFGLARSFTPETPTPVSPHDPTRISSPRITRTGLLVGTPAYMAPEQFDGPGDARSDQFAFCAGLYEALYGVHPFADALGSGVASLIGTLDPNPPTGSPVPRRIFAAVCRGLSRAPSGRFARMEDLLLEIGAVPPDRPARVSGERMLILTIASSTLAILIALAASVAARSAGSSDRPPAEPPLLAPSPAVAAPAPMPTAPPPAQVAGVVDETAPAPRPVEDRRADESARTSRRARKPKPREAAPRHPPRTAPAEVPENEQPGGIFRTVYDGD